MSAPCAGARQRGKGSRYLASGSQYAPVHAEVLEGDLPVRGALPPALDGTYVRTGPNPKQEVSGEYHWCAAPPPPARHTACPLGYS